ncbi:lysozyme family protein [Enterococcus cecorum]|uniref:lysozyme family protein n=1 Tax=Enterococcus cecorum TaxID=44008 RepID=UPI003CD0D37D
MERKYFNSTVKLPGKRYRYLHIFSIFHNGGYLYHNGGNYYYAKIVKWNQYQYESYEKIIHLIE